ncbi:haloacid dehalogenase type II [Cellulophaga sp. E16_2]|uniref:Haloacid dehalogenase, type II n=1 Tax=Cellulophaga algicola (strain DSM 14237 / IC166 / ACAM 630) TaxID=688270 RepID=E6XBB8_CELAD|nr:MULTISPECIES: haloacid dehalogenase type II [Cellulophaga]ADV49982.1 haloacid dehalogenase, type II [Cellulophaga algicola DSM 14237]MBO0592356.1 haloacid dehalogenase type II [Cellulophaga sp. E16_2]
MSHQNEQRRNFVKKSALLGLAGMAMPHLGFSANEAQLEKENISYVLERPKVIFFDVNETLLDLNAMRESVGNALGKRNDLLSLWFTTMLQYSLVDTVARQYHDFGIVGVATLQMVASNNKIKLTKEQATEAILKPLRSLPAHPEVRSSLENLKKAGYKIVSFTNSSNLGVKTQFENSGLIDLFEERLSVEDIGKFKPHSDAYDWAARKMGVQPKECLLVAAHGWDIAGALWANWRAAFISRPGAQLYPLAPTPEFNESNLKLIADKLIALT